MSSLYFLFRASWKTVILAIGIGLISGIATLGLLVMIRMLLRGQGAISTDMAWAFAGLCATVLVTRVVVQVLLVRLSQRSMSHMTRRLTRQLLTVPLRRLEDLGGHRFVAALTTGIQVIAKMMNKFPVICVNVVIVLCGMAFLAWISPPLMGALSGFIVLSVICFALFAKRARRHMRQSRTAQTGMLKLLRDMVMGVKELKIHRQRREGYLNEAVTAADRSLRDSTNTGSKYQALTSSGSRLLVFVAIGLLLFAWPRVQALDGDQRIGIIITIFFLLGPLEQISSSIPLFLQTQVAIARLRKLGLELNAESEPLALDDVALPTEWERIGLRGAGILYTHEEEDPDEEVPATDDEGGAAPAIDKPLADEKGAAAQSGFRLGPIDLTLRRGELLFVVGGNGSGKTTLVKLFTGLYAPDEGEIHLDDRKIEPQEIDAYRQLFSVVFADVVVFDQFYGFDRTGLEEQAQNYLRQLRLDADVSVGNGGFSTTTRLSRGQRKRLALLIALLEDRPVYVFDEWAADQDPLFKRIFYSEILPDLKARHKAVLVVTHDDNYFKLADRIVTLRDGQMIDGYQEEYLVQRARPPLAVSEAAAAAPVPEMAG